MLRDVLKVIFGWATHNQFRETMDHVVHQLDATLVNHDDQDIVAMAVTYRGIKYSVIVRPALVSVGSLLEWPTENAPHALRDAISIIGRHLTFDLFINEYRGIQYIKAELQDNFNKMPAPELAAKIKEMVVVVYDLERRVERFG